MIFENLFETASLIIQYAALTRFDRVEVDDAVTDSFRKLGAVRDGDKPYPALVEHLEQQIPDLRLRDDIEHRAYLIGDDKLSLGVRARAMQKRCISPPDSSAG